ncbi:hypothetical protein LTR10_023666 [Elasticomyces elasticus]|nr:hypothetical protein LTR10_023666 [Elasticomyces elasticus]KAK5024564.1 hypothetical protein LTR13_010820 [Exophiala sideris]
MDSVEKTIEAACADRTIPGAVLAAASKNGDFTYTKGFGLRSMQEGEAAACSPDTIMLLFSGTKIVTTIAALQLVEKGRISLDSDVGDILPEVAQLQVLKEEKDGKPVYEKRNAPITLRHSSGLAYPRESPLLKEYLESQGIPLMAPTKTVVDGFNFPLVFQPGTSWVYSTGIDWAGLLIARIAKTDLESYCQEHIFKPLGISDATFWPDRRQEVKARLASMSVRDPKVPGGEGKAIPFPQMKVHGVAEEELGGQGLYTSAPSYLKILRSILDDDEKLLSKSTSALMFEPQLSAESQKAIQAVYKSEPKGGPCAIGTFPPNVSYDFGLGGVLTTQDVNEKDVTWRKKGYLNWSGAPNFFWFIDRTAGVCGVFGAQFMFGGDVRTKKLITEFEKAVFEGASAK